MNMNIVEFCDKHNIKWRPIELKISTKPDGKMKKEMLPMLGQGLPDVKHFADEAWCKKEMINLQKYYKKLSQVEKDKLYISMDTSEIYQLDVDWLESKSYSQEAEAFVADMLKSCPWHKSTTKVLGKHIFFRLDKKLKKKRQQLQLSAECELYNDLEILSGQMGWCPSNEIVQNCFNMMTTLCYSEMPLKFGATLYGDKPKKKFVCRGTKGSAGGAGAATNKKQNEIKGLDKDDKIYKYADIIISKYLDEYSDWMKILWALKSEGARAISEHISRKSDKFNLFEFQKKWDSIQSNGSITIGTLYYYAKLSDPKAYRALQNEEMSNMEFLDSDDTQAELFYRANENNIVYKDNSIFLYLGNEEGTKGRWFHDEKNERVKKILSDYLSELQNKFLNTLWADLNKQKDKFPSIEDEDEKQKCADDVKRLQDKIEFVSKLCGRLKNCAKINTVCERLKSLLSVKDYQEIQFDKNQFLLPFNNTCYDLKSHNWVGTRREDYILETTGYNWIAPTDEEVETISKLFEEIFPSKEVRQEYTHYLATGLYGIPIEKFIFASGGGGNGKGVINELQIETLGNFGYLANNAVLLNPLKDGGNPAIANMSGKRFINYREPDERQSINLSTVKELTGGKGISARKLYSNDDKVQLVATQVCELNKKCPMVGDLGDSIARRLREIPFVSTYTNIKELLDKKEVLSNVYKANPYYKTVEFQEKFKFALFIYLIRYCKKWEQEQQQTVCQKLYACKEVSDLTKKYIEYNDNVFNILKQHYVLDMDDNTAMCPAREFWVYFKDSDFYRTLTKQEQNKTYSEKAVIDHLRSSTSTRIYFNDKFSVKNTSGKVRTYRNILRFWRLKTDAEVFKEQCEAGNAENVLELEFEE